MGKNKARNSPSGIEVSERLSTSPAANSAPPVASISTSDSDLPPPVLCSSSGTFPTTTSESGKGYFHIQIGDEKFHLKQLSEHETKKSVLTEERYDKSLLAWIEDNPETMQHVYENTEYENYQPTEEAIMVVRGLLTAFFNLLNSEEKHSGLNCLENYLLTSPIFDYHSASADDYAADEYANEYENDSTLSHKHVYAKEKLSGAGEYVRKVKVIIIRDGEHKKATTTLAKRTAAIVDIIFNKIFKGKNKLPEWVDLRRALKKRKFQYADCHPCLWSWKKRLMLFVDLSSYISNRENDLHDIVYKAIIETDFFDEDWREKLDDMAPLKRVLEHKIDKDNGGGNDTGDAAASASKNQFCGTSKDKSSGTTRLSRNNRSHNTSTFNFGGTVDHQSYVSDKRWRAGRTLIRFMKNCYAHLTERHINKLGVRDFINIGITDNVFYGDLRFLNHIITYKLYPMLWIKLFANLHMGQYRF